MPTGAVITADIVNSMLLSKPQFNGLIRSFNGLLQPHKHEFYRGDSFQVYIKEPQVALELGIKLRLAAKKIQADNQSDIDIRLAIGIGEITTPVRTIRQSSDEPFILSGRALDELSDSADRLRVVSSDDQTKDLFRVIARFIDYILHDLTSKQSEVIFELLQGNTQTRAAKKLKKSQVTINRQAHAGGWSEIERLILDYKTAISKYAKK